MHNPGILETLTDDQRAQLFTWMEIHPMRVVLDKVAAPPPEGFGLKTHITTLRRFYEGARLLEVRHQLSALGSAVTAPDAASLERIANSAVTQQALKLITMPRVKANNLANAIKWLVALRTQEIRADKNNITRERLAHTVACEERKLQLSELKHANAQPAPDSYKSDLLEQFRVCFEQQEQAETLVQI